MNAARDRLLRRLNGIPAHGYAGPSARWRPWLARALLAVMLVPMALVLGALAGCAGNPPITAGAEPVDAQCEALCMTPCDVRIPPWSPADPDSPGAWDELPGQVLVPARLRLWTCETHRQACVRCLDRLRETGVIR